MFVKAWRRVVNVFRVVGADNVTWLWTVNLIAPNGSDDPGLVAGGQLRHLGRH